MEFPIRVTYKIAEICQIQISCSIVRCKRQWLSPISTAAGLTATLTDRMVTIQFEWARFNVFSIMFVCVVRRYNYNMVY